MKKILLLLSVCFSLSGCTLFLMKAVSDSQPKLSFKVNGEYFMAEEDNVGSFRIFEVAGKGFAISYSGSNWDTENTLRDVSLGLNCGFIAGQVEKDVEYAFSEDDSLDTYPVFKYTIYEEYDSTPGSTAYRMKTVWFNATDGWFKITNIDKKGGTISGKFAFTAACDDPSSDEVFEITEGFFKKVPFVSVQDLEF